MKSFNFLKLPKRFFALLLIFAVVVKLPIFSVNAYAGAENTTAAVKTGDHGIIGIIIAGVAFILTAFITTKMTKHNNNKKNRL